MNRLRTASSTMRADSDGVDWAPVLALLDEIGGEDSIQVTFRQLVDELERSSYRTISADDFVQRYRANTLSLISGVRRRRMPGPDDDGAELQETGQSRARAGIELSDMVRITLVAQSSFGAYITKRARERGIREDVIVEVLRYLDAWHAWSMKELIAGFQETALAMVTRDQRRQDRAMRQLLGGGLTPVEIRQAAAECGLDPHGVYHVLRAVPAGRPFNDVRRALVTACLGSSCEPALTTMYGDVCLVMRDAPTGSVPFLVGVSPPVAVSDLAEGFRLATRSADAARQMGRAGFVTLRDLSITASVTADGEVAQVLKQRYLEPFADMGAAGEAILDTVAEYLARHRSVADTGQAMFVHVNTVRYRLERFETMTECSLKDVRTLAEVWWILHLRTR